jgi:tetratricopeptide (TPR) repeat protein
MVKEDFPAAFKHLKEALKLSEQTNDIVSYVLSSYWLGMAFSFNCEFENAYRYIEKALNLNAAAGNLWGISAMKSSLATCYYFNGKISVGYQTSQEAIDMAEESGDIYSKAMAFTSHGFSCLGKGFLEEAATNLMNGADLCERINFLSWNALAQFNLAETYSEIGEYTKSKAHYEKTIRLTEQNRWLPSWRNLCKAAIIKEDIRSDGRDFNLETLYSYVKENRLKLYDGWIPRVIGEILLNVDDQHLVESEEWVKKAIEADRGNSMNFHLGRSYALYAELLKRMGDLSNAKENLNKAIEVFGECRADGWVKKYEDKLASLS